MAATASVRVTKRRERNPATTADPQKVTGTMPDAKMYGVYAPQYAALLAQPQDSIALRVMNAGALQGEARREQEAYAEEMQRAREADAVLQRNNAYYGFTKDVANRRPDYMDRGVAGYEKVVMGPDGLPTIEYDNVREQVGNADALNNSQADRYGVYATATKTLREAGVDIPAEYLGQLLAPPTQKTPVPVTTGTAPLTPGDQTQRYSADEGLTAEEQLQLAQTRAANAGKDDSEAEVTIEIPTARVNGQVTKRRVIKGTPTELRAMGYDPDTGQKLNPKAGAVGGAAPATPAANRKNAAVVPIRNGRAAVAKVYPQLADQVTQVERDPNSALGKANPTSWHNRTRAAVDMQPIKGMTFNQYVQGYRDAGYEILEAKNEVGKGRSKHATGDHWHVVLGENKTQQVLARRQIANPNVTRVDRLQNGDSLVTLKDGTQRVYRKGKRVG